MKIYTGCVTDRGNFRLKNQDRAICRVKRDKHHILAVACVCDGIGSFEQSEIAAEMMTSGISRWVDGLDRFRPGALTKEDLLEDLDVTIRELNTLVCGYRSSTGVDIGCTMSMLVLIDECYYVFHVGDSRIYCVNDTMYQITHDEVSVAETGGHVKSKLANYIGRSTELWVNKFGGEAIKGDIFLLGSDGLFKQLNFEDVAVRAEKIKSDKRAQSVCCELVSLVLERGERDNVSCIMICVNRTDRQ